MMEHLLQQITDCILNFDRAAIEGKVRAALEAGIPPEQILNDGMIAAMNEVGRRFEVGEFFIPEMLVAAMTMQKGQDVLQPRLAGIGVKSAGRVVIGTVKGDLHDVGKNLVAMMLKGTGFDVIDLGVDIPPERFVEAVRSSSPNILAMSALLTTTMTNMKSTVAALKDAGLRGRVKVMVGGAPLSDAYAKEIGADGYAADANRAVKLARNLIS
jgi:5-methyltetrahydrofolate--homocysteine methyltransferase